MLPVSHFAIPFFIGKSTKLKYVWVAMLFGLIPDIFLFFLDWLGPGLGLNERFTSSYPINLFMHSVFGLLILLILIPIEKRYFYAGFVGYASHLIADYMTHSAIRYPFYPISGWQAPVFIITYVDKVFIFGTHIIIFVLLLIIIFKEMRGLLDSVLNKFNRRRIWILALTYLIISLVLGVFYVSLLNFPSPMLFLAPPFIIFNMAALGVMFLLDLKDDKRFENQFKKLFKWLS
jgi:hypothetical protein